MRMIIKIFFISNGENIRRIRMTLHDVVPGQSVKVVKVGSKGPFRRRLMDMGVTPGVEITVVKVAPLGDPMEVSVRGYSLSLRKDETKEIEVE